MSRAKVALFGNPNRAAWVDTDATAGATIARDLRLPDGSVPTLAQLAAALSIESAAAGGEAEQTPNAITTTLWARVLEKPANVVALAALSSAGYLRRTAGGDLVAEALGPAYLTQTVDLRYWTAGDFARGTNLIGVRYAGGDAFVYLPHDLPTERIVVVKDEAGLGRVTVRIYET